ncbi:hypothetical protein [Acidimangrovimonas pyrenivorans]|uniref:Uncharacterized protein n=1 Tax=Acidimangrovimonas pyrenivorans TaxID=2030798 RepID=A0ABV7AK32_9RHOB
MAENLQHLVSLLGDEHMSALLDSTTKVAMAASALGIEASTEELVQLEAVKLAVLADMPLDTVQAVSQLKQVPSVAERLRAKHADAETQQQIADEMAKLSPQARLTKARELGLTGPKVAPKGPRDRESDLRVVNGIKSLSVRLSEARKRGLA